MALMVFGCGKETKPAPEFPVGMIWLGPDISGWAKTAKLDAYLNPPVIVMNYDKASVWPVRTGKTDGAVSANSWIIFEVNAGDGQWYAATWEWLKRNQTSKTLNNKLGTYIKKTPPVPSKWHPAKGQKIGIMVSGLARFPDDRTVAERSNISWGVWK